MFTSTLSGIRDSYAAMRHLHWSPAEKAVARKAFETALKREFEALITETKKRWPPQSRNPMISGSWKIT